MSDWDDPVLSYATAEPRRLNTGDDDVTAEQHESVIGRGGQGVVVSGRDRHLVREVAWKVASEPDAKARLRHEARVLAMLEHPNIVPVYDLVDDGELRMATRYVRGQTIRALLAHGGVIDARALRHVLAVADALALAHLRGVVHRDVKPDNIMVGEFGETQLIDWGLAAVLADDEPIGEVLGTPRYMSPEQARGERPTRAFDTWGLGATLYELVTGTPLWPDASGTTILTRLRLGQRPAINPQEVKAPAELRAILERALSPHPEARYPDARAFADDLAAFLDGRIVAAHEYRAWDLLRRFARAWRLPLGIGAAVLLTVAIGVPLAFDSIGKQRDRAMAAFVRAETTVAIREHAAGQRPEAERAAINVLREGESPEARGILAANARAPRFERAALVPIPGECETSVTAPNARFVACGTASSVIAFQRDKGTAVEVLRESGTYLSYTLTDDALWIAAREALVRVDLPSGARTQLPSCAGMLTTVGDGVIDVSFGCAMLHGPRDSRTLRAPNLQAATGGIHTADGQLTTLAALDEEGRLFIVEDEQRTVMTPLASATHDWVTAAWVGGRYITGSTRSQLAAIDPQTGAILARVSLEPARMIRQMGGDRAGRYLVATIDAGAPAVLDAASLALIGRLPRDGGTAQIIDDGVATFGRIVGRDAASTWPAVALWRIPPGPIAQLDGLIGVTSLDLGRDLVVSYERNAASVDVERGIVLAQPDPDAAIAKAVIRRGPDLLVAKAANTPDEALRPQPAAPIPSFMTMHGVRRLVALPDGRFARSAAGFGLGVELPTGEIETIDTARFADLVGNGFLIAGLSTTQAWVKVWDVTGAPVLVSLCPVSGASALAMVDQAVLSAHAHHVSATNFECELTDLFTLPRGAPQRIAATRDWVAAGTREGDLVVWDWTGQVRAVVSQHVEPVTALTIGAERWLVSGAWDGRVRFLDLDILYADVTILATRIQAAWPTF